MIKCDKNGVAVKGTALELITELTNIMASFIDDDSVFPGRTVKDRYKLLMFCAEVAKEAAEEEEA